jgi:hypothetical protein
MSISRTCISAHSFEDIGQDGSDASFRLFLLVPRGMEQCCSSWHS